MPFINEELKLSECVFIVNIYIPIILGFFLISFLQYVLSSFIGFYYCTALIILFGTDYNNIIYFLKLIQIFNQSKSSNKFVRTLEYMNIGG